MESNKYHFVNSFPSRGPRTRRAIELEQSSARAHAARISSSRRVQHQRSQKEYREAILHGDRLDDQKSLLYTQQASKLPIQVRQKVPRKSDPQSSRMVDEPRHWPMKVSRPINVSTLDPFLSPAVDLSIPDRHLLHYCKLQDRDPILRGELITTRLDEGAEYNLWRPIDTGFAHD